MSAKVPVLGVNIDPVSLPEAVDRVAAMIARGKGGMVVTANPEIVWRARRDRVYRAVLNDADLVVADGIGVVMAARMAGFSLPSRVAGFDLMQALLEEAQHRGWRVYFLGGEPGIAEEAARRVSARLTSLQLAGTHHGYFWHDDRGWAEVAAALQTAAPQLVFVGMGAPLQELWMAHQLGRGGSTLASVVPRSRPVYGHAVMLGVGGSLDVLAGKTARAPAWMRAHGLEWAFRLRDPRRWRRAVSLPAFVGAAAIWAFQHRIGGRGAGGHQPSSGEGT